jgi:hypothetical protein
MGPHVNKMFDENTNLLFAIDPYAAWVSWEGCVPWELTTPDYMLEPDAEPQPNEIAPGVIGLLRRTGKAYEYEMGEMKARGYDISVILRTKDILEGKLKNRMVVTLAAKNQPLEELERHGTRFMVRFIDDQGDFNAVVYLLKLGKNGQPEESEEEQRRWHRPGRPIGRGPRW